MLRSLEYLLIPQVKKCSNGKPVCEFPSFIKVIIIDKIIPVVSKALVILFLLLLFCRKQQITDKTLPISSIAMTGPSLTTKEVANHILKLYVDNSLSLFLPLTHIERLGSKILIRAVPSFE